MPERIGSWRRVGHASATGGPDRRSIGAIRVHEAETRRASPFARSLVFAYVAAYLYEQDTPLAERRAQALALDRELLASWSAMMRWNLLDIDVLNRVETILQCSAEGFKARNHDELTMY